MKDAAKEYLKMYSCPQTFSNALSPIQVAIVRAALGIVKSSEGATRRKQLHENSVYLREQLTRNGFACLGEPSAIGPVFPGEDGPCPRAVADVVGQGSRLEFRRVSRRRNQRGADQDAGAVYAKAHADYFVRHQLVAAPRHGLDDPAGVIAEGQGMSLMHWTTESSGRAGGAVQTASISSSLETTLPACSARQRSTSNDCLRSGRALSPRRSVERARSRVNASKRSTLKGEVSMLRRCVASN
jgi:hypothetical protein